MTTDFDAIYDDYRMLHDAIRELPDRYFVALLSSEVRERRQVLRDTIALDASFKLLSRLEAALKDKALRATRRPGRRKGDAISHELEQLVRRLAKRQRCSPRVAARDLPIEHVLILLRDHFRTRGESLHRTLSLAKAYFKSFRNWYAHGRIGEPTPKPPDVEEVMSIVLDISGAIAI